MVQSQFSLSWDSYKSSICNGFSALQQSGEFVDMTIAADGHFVKVHQMLVALASPYLKELITSTPCQHPVIFLNNVSHKILCLLLEYIYTGEVVVPADCLSAFGETAKSLHIRGLESIGTNAVPTRMSSNISQLDESDLCHITGHRRVIVSSAANQSNEISLPVKASKIFVKRGPASKNQSITDTQEYSDFMDDSNIHDSDNDYTVEEISKREKTNHDKLSSKLQFTVSIRGSLQIILNRYLYNMHSTKRSGLRRWRCVDYRNNKCTAYVTTKGNVVLNRANPHNHGFHDKKILSKIEKNAVYSAIEELEAYQEREINKEDNANKSTEENDANVENDGFLSFEEFEHNIDEKSNA